MQKKPTAWLHAAHLLPGVQKHDIILVQVILSEVSHFCHKESARLIGAFKQTRFVKCDFFLQSGGDTEEVSGNDWLSCRFEIWAHLYLFLWLYLLSLAYGAFPPNATQKAAGSCPSITICLSCSESKSATAFPISLSSPLQPCEKQKHRQIQRERFFYD